MFKFKIGDEILITSGKDKGKKGKVEKVFGSQSKVIVEGINIYKRHKKVSKNQPAGIFEIARPIDLAKISLICPKCGKSTRVGFIMDGNDKKRICKKCSGRLS